MNRPTLIDEQDGKCPICSGWDELKVNGKHCADCKQLIPDMLNMGSNGYESPKPDHFHLRPVMGISGRESMMAELCADCYLVRFSEAYPENDLPPSVVSNKRSVAEISPILA